MSRADRGGSSVGGRRGAGLAEVAVALVLLTVGLLGITGLLRLAARETAHARRVEAAQWDAAAVVDSVLGGWLGAEGERSAPWGVVRWGPYDNGLRLEALPDDAAGREPYLRVHLVLRDTAP